MTQSSDIGLLRYLYFEDIEPGEPTDAPEFLINATAELLSKTDDGRNWIPLVVKETAREKYKVIGNSFIYAVAEEAGLEKVWCVIADDSEETAEVTQILAGERLPKLNLSVASRDDIKSALQFLVEKPGSPLKGIKLAVATERIEEAPRKYWKNLEPITKLKCGITKGKKLDTLKEIFYLTPEPIPDVITDPELLDTFTVGELRKMATKRGMSGTSKMKKADLVAVLSKSA
ncbi:MAG: Rho termination factor [Symploca sp. SIO2D2]|nr:Rho termination factor [Symploca sp. SIO2D2]